MPSERSERPTAVQVVAHRGSSDDAPEHTLHVGDTPAADVEGARAAGIHPVLVDPFDHHPDLDCVRVRHLDDLVVLLSSMRGHA